MQPGPARQRLDLVYADLARARQDLESTYLECASYSMPHRPRQFVGDTNKLKRRNRLLVDSTPVHEMAVFTSGMVAGMARPSSQWFMLANPLARGRRTSRAAEVWLEEARDAFLDVFDRSNFYTSFGSMCGDAGRFGTSPMIILEDSRKVARFSVFPVLSYCIGQDATGRVDRIAREFTLTLRQLVDEFGLARLPAELQHAYASGPGQREQPFSVGHLIEPNPERGMGLGAAYLPFRETYWLREGQPGGPGTLPSISGVYGASAGEPPADSASPLEEGILRVGGYHEFPVVVARWDRNDEDVYATDWPLVIALPDIKDLQSRVRLGTNALEKGIDPPLLGSTAVRGRPVSQLAGAITYDPSYTGSGTGLRDLHSRVDVNHEHLELSNEQLRQRIRRALYTDLFLLLVQDARSQPPTAEEVRERKLEKMQVLGPVLERFADDVFDPLIERVSAIMIRRSLPAWEMGEDGLLPMPPEELVGVQLRPEYTSEVAQAQKFASVGALERHAAFVFQLGEADPTVLDNFNRDEAVRQHRIGSGVSPKVSVDPLEVAAMRRERARQRQAAALQEQIPAFAKAAKDLTEADGKHVVQTARTIMAAGAA